MECSLVESEHPVGEATPEGKHSPNTPETSVVSAGLSIKDLMGTIAERSICCHFAVAKLKIARVRNVELDWSASSDDPFALSVTPRTVLGVTASTPVILFTSMEV